MLHGSSPERIARRVRPSSVLSAKASTVCLNVEYFLAILIHYLVIKSLSAN